MYSGKTAAVELPSDLRGGILIVLTNGYVCYASRSWRDKDRRRTADDRISIGKLDPRNPNKLFPTKDFMKSLSQKPPILTPKMLMLNQGGSMPAPQASRSPSGLSWP